MAGNLSVRPARQSKGLRYPWIAVPVSSVVLSPRAPYLKALKVVIANLECQVTTEIHLLLYFLHYFLSPVVVKHKP